MLESFTALLPAEDAAASVLSAPFDPETLAATSDRAARLDEKQIDLGEGPAWDACRTYLPVDMRVGEDRDFAAWPVFAFAVQAAAVASVLAVPMRIGTSSIGAVSLYNSTPIRFDASQLELAERLAGVLARTVVEQAMTSLENSTLTRDPALSRREVHQATGMVMSQMRSSPADALLMIRAYAFAEEISVREVAAQIIARTLDFSRDTPA